ncbi:Crp/Fnr family transcriptional regulator [Truepera radiovictrix]|uniref:Transcriptional regulator, Crp/Fnr family n=1 Tax=Truepera radiovictrix (strain DSM 17093 / CIP 108686 / LMG 22925 / RQ-24) TaxID=649638 RepID=D7CTB8_TRURR|nr:Crp/Fnr family transcriptional regulator [Truepera radiovictrix]ADI13775.1 transcriptional regulator, Crp/Fnr family [Truepera radiovictrix DSM 17093]WMT57659.1 Crp/Fnr family transcriptional regulator [Truepera radiovictrix]
MTPSVSVLPPSWVGPPPNPQHDYASRDLAKGDALYYAGDEASTIYRVTEGLFKLSIDLPSGRERVIGVSGPGDFIGALTPAPHYAENAEALSPKVRVLVIPKEDAPKLHGELHKATGAQLLQLKDALEDTDLPVGARLARTLLRLGHRFGHTTAAGRVQLTLPLTHDHLAAMIGAARETTTAALSEMRERGALSGTRGQYSFDPSELRAYVRDLLQPL